MRRTQPKQPLKVLVAGGGAGALETVLAIRTLAGARTDVTLIAPARDFVYRPLSTSEPYGLGTARRYPLAKIAEDLDAHLVEDSLEWVVPSFHRAFLRTERELAYDALVVAVGARTKPAWRHDVLTFRGPENVAAMRALIQELVRGRIASVAFVVPEGILWTLPLYELALNTADRARTAGVGCELTFVTDETEPLQVFGGEVSAMLAGLLDEAGVALRLNATPHVRMPGRVEISGPEGDVACDRIVALPVFEGPALRGLPSDDAGFIPVDRHGQVPGVEHVYAVGDCVSFPVKQGGLAAQQADAVAEVIAKRAGAPFDPRPFRPVLRGVLLAGDERRFFRAELGATGTIAAQAAEQPLWWPTDKLAGAYLAPYLATEQERPSGPGPKPARASFAERTK